MVTQLTNSDTANSENSEANSEANSSDATEDTLGILWPWNLPLASQGLGRQLRTLMALATPATQVCFQIYKRTCCDRMIVHCEVDDLCRFLHFEHQFYLQLCKASWPAKTGLTWKSLGTQSLGYLGSLSAQHLPAERLRKTVAERVRQTVVLSKFTNRYVQRWIQWKGKPGQMCIKNIKIHACCILLYPVVHLCLDLWILIALFGPRRCRPKQLAQGPFDTSLKPLNGLNRLNGLNDQKEPSKCHERIE